MKLDDLLARLDEMLHRLNSLPDDPPGMRCYGAETEGASIFLTAAPIEGGKAMPFDNPTAVVNGIHDALADDQGLVEVTNGTIGDWGRYIYSVVKTAGQPSGVQYCLTLHLDVNGEQAAIQGFFSERGVTGMRDATVFEQCVRAGTINPPDMNGWTFDPYDPKRRRGFLMNQSERAEYDRAFPMHPLTELRKMVRFLVQWQQGTDS